MLRQYHHRTQVSPASKHLQPLSIKEDLKLKGWLREWEVGIHPSGLHVHSLARIRMTSVVGGMFSMALKDCTGHKAT